MGGRGGVRWAAVWHTRASGMTGQETGCGLPAGLTSHSSRLSSSLHAHGRRAQACVCPGATSDRPAPCAYIFAQNLPAQPCSPQCSRVLSCCAAFLGLSSAACSNSASRLPHCLSSDTAVLGPMPDTPGTLSAGPGQGRERRDGSAGQAQQAACHARASAEGGARKAAPCEEGEPAAQP